MPIEDVLMNLGDAIAGVDRTGNYLKGNKLAAEIDQTEAQTEFAMEGAKQRRIQAEIDEIERAARERVQRASQATGFQPGDLNFGDLVVGKMGSDFSGASQGQLYQQQRHQRDIAGTPPETMLGEDFVTDPERQAALDALAPASAIAGRNPRGGGTVIGTDEDGNPIYYRSNTGAPLRNPETNTPITPAPRPATPPQPGSQQKNYDFMVSHGVPAQAAMDASQNMEFSAERAFQEGMADAAKLFLQGDEALDHATQYMIQKGAQHRPLIPDPPEAPGTEEFQEGDEAVDPNTQQTIVMRGGIWVDADTGRPYR